MTYNFSVMTPSKVIKLEEDCAASEIYLNEIAADLINWLDQPTTDIATLDTIYATGVELCSIWGMFHPFTLQTVNDLGTPASEVFVQGATGQPFAPTT